jgi:long-subunit acyl-CoA synthetase (AMP-forming)
MDPYVELFDCKKTKIELGKVGEIMAKSEIVMKGYLNLPEETSAIFSKDGFVHTGDLARYDENGVLYYEGRLKELVSISTFIFIVTVPKSYAILQ